MSLLSQAFRRIPVPQNTCTPEYLHPVSCHRTSNGSHLSLRLLLPLHYDQSAIARQAVPLLKGISCKQIHQHHSKAPHTDFWSSQKGKRSGYSRKRQFSHPPYKLHPLADSTQPCSRAGPSSSLLELDAFPSCFPEKYLGSNAH